MKKKLNKSLLGILTLSMALTIFSPNISLANEITSNNNTVNDYENAIKDGAISNSMTQSSFSQLQEASKIAEKELEEFDKNNNFEEVNYLRAGFSFKKGDILITNGTSYYGLTGHAAIITGSNSVLDAPGKAHTVKKNGKNVTLNTTRQLTTRTFINKYTDDPGEWVKVYRPKHNDIAIAAAKWADRNYYSSSGSATQKKFPKYTLATNLTSTNYVYCSKIIYQAYYYGSGNKSYVWPKLAQGIILPYDIPISFTWGNAPKKVKTY